MQTIKKVYFLAALTFALPCMASEPLLAKNQISTEAVTTDSPNWISVHLGSSYTNVNFDVPSGTAIENQPILTTDFALDLFANKVFTWTRKQSGETASDQANYAKNAALINRIEANFNRISPLPLSLSYSQYIFNTYLTAGNTKDVLLISQQNTTAASGNMTSADPGLYQATSGQTLGLKTKRERIDFRIIGDHKMGEGDSSFGLFLDRLQKPLEDQTANWTNLENGKKVTVVYSDALLETIGFSFRGLAPKRIYGWFPNSLEFDFGKTTVMLTDNFSLVKKMPNYSIYKFAIAGEYGYRKKVNIGLPTELLVMFYGRLDAYSMSDDSNNNSDSSSSSSSSSASIPISNDFLYGVRAEFSL